MEFPHTLSFLFLSSIYRLQFLGPVACQGFGTFEVLFEEAAFDVHLKLVFRQAAQLVSGLFFLLQL